MNGVIPFNILRQYILKRCKNYDYYYALRKEITTNFSIWMYISFLTHNSFIFFLFYFDFIIIFFVIVLINIIN